MGRMGVFKKQVFLYRDLYQDNLPQHFGVYAMLWPHCWWTFHMGRFNDLGCSFKPADPVPSAYQDLQKGTLNLGNPP